MDQSSKTLQRYDTLPFPMPELAIHKKRREIILKVLVLLPELNKTDFEPTEKGWWPPLGQVLAIERMKLLSAGRLLLPHHPDQKTSFSHWKPFRSSRVFWWDTFFGKNEEHNTAKTNIMSTWTSQLRIVASGGLETNSVLVVTLANQLCNWDEWECYND